MLIKIFKNSRSAVSILLCLILTTAALAEPVEKHDELLHNVKFTGDFDAMNQRHVIRALVVYNDMFYFFDQGQARGASYESLKLFEKFINKKLKKGTVKIRVVFVPTTRDRLFSDLVEGRGDLAAANLTITPERLQLVDFSDPFANQIREVMVPGPKAEKLAGLDDLAGRKILVRKSSSYFKHLQNLNQTFKKKGLAPIILKPADKYLEDADLLEMVNSGILPWAVVDSHKAKFWAGVYDKLIVREDLAIHSGSKIAWAFRKNSPQLKKIVNQFKGVAKII